eukprot:3442578-Amphidinium_carterae.1
MAFEQCTLPCVNEGGLLQSLRCCTAGFDLQICKSSGSSSLLVQAPPFYLEQLLVRRFCIWPWSLPEDNPVPTRLR